MNNIAVVKTTCDGDFTENEIVIDELNLKITCIIVPYKRKMKRKDKAKLLSKLDFFDKIFTSEPCLKAYEKGVNSKSWLSFFLVDFLIYLQRYDADDKVGVLCEDMTENISYTLTALTNSYRVIYLYSDNVNVISAAENQLASSGVPLYIKTASDISKIDTRYLVKVDSDLSVYDVCTNKEYIDLKIEFLYPLSRFSCLPLDEIVKAALELKNCNVNDIDSMVKIIGEISK